MDDILQYHIITSGWNIETLLEKKYHYMKLLLDMDNSYHLLTHWSRDKIAAIS